MPGLRHGVSAVHPPRITVRAAVEQLAGSSTGLVVSAVLVGLGPGACAVASRYLILWFTPLFTGQGDFSGAGRVANPLVPLLGPWFVLLAPVAGGPLYGTLTERFAREDVPGAYHGRRERNRRRGHRS